MFKANSVLVLGLVWLTYSPGGQDLQAAEALPRYKLEVGQDLTYSGHDEFQYEGGKFLTDTTWRIWVVRKNDDGSWKLLLRHGTRFRQARAADAGGSDHETITFAWCDLSPDGALTENDSFGFRMNPYTLLVKLPPDDAAASAGWTSKYQRMDESNRYKLLADQSTSQKMAIELRRESPLNEIYGSEYRDVVTFDRDRGLPESIATQSKQTYGFSGKGSGSTRLDKVQTHDAAWCRSFWADAEQYFAAHSAFEKASETSGRLPANFETTLQSAVANLRAAKEQIKSADLRKQIDDDLAQHEKYAKHSLESARKQQALLDQPAADWSCPGLDGKQHSLIECRGRVVVLDFWYRGCGWCIRAMPQMKEIARHFADKPVTIFGMNTDREEADARFVIDKLGLNYANLKATGVPQKYGVSGFPTLLIIDQDGVVRDIHEGYAPDLKEKVIESIDRLLKKKS